MASVWKLPWRATCSIARVEVVHDGDVQLEGQVLGVPVRLGRGVGAFAQEKAARARRRACATRGRAWRLASMGRKVGHGGVHQQRLHGVAHARAVRLRVHGDAHAHLEIGLRSMNTWQTPL
jgi:hypothetical protein